MVDSEKDKQDDAGMAVMVVLVACALGWAAWAKLPQAFLVIPGVVFGTAATYVPGSDGPEWRSAAIKLLIAAVVVGVAFVLLAGPIGADAQLRRFDRAWGEETSWSVASKHPWAVIPPGFAFFLAGFGAMLFWRAK